MNICLSTVLTMHACILWYFDTTSRFFLSTIMTLLTGVNLIALRMRDFLKVVAGFVGNRKID